MQKIHEIDPIIGSVPHIEFSPNGQRLAIVQTSKELITLYDSTSWEIVIELEVAIISFAFLDSLGLTFAIGTSHGEIKIWQDGVFVKTKHIHSAKVDKMGFVQGILVSSSFVAQEVSLWNLIEDTVTLFNNKQCNLPYAISKSQGIVILEDNNHINIHKIHHTSPLYSIDIRGLQVVKSAISPDGAYIVSLCDNQNIALFSADGTRIAEIKNRGFDGLLIGFDLLSNHIIIALEEPRKIDLWHIEKRAFTDRIPYKLDNIRSFSMNTKNEIAIASTDHFLTHSSVEIWSLS